MPALFTTTFVRLSGYTAFAPAGHVDVEYIARRRGSVTAEVCATEHGFRGTTDTDDAAQDFVEYLLALDYEVQTCTAE